MADAFTFVIQPTARKMLAAMQTMTPGVPPPPEILLGTVALGAMAWAVNAVR